MKLQLTIEQSNELINLGLDEDISDGNFEYPFETLFTSQDLIKYITDIKEMSLEMNYDSEKKEWKVCAEDEFIYSEKELVDALFRVTKDYLSGEW